MLDIYYQEIASKRNLELILVIKNWLISLIY